MAAIGKAVIIKQVANKELTSIDKMFEKGIKLRDKGDLKSAVDVFTDIIKKYPKHESLAGVHGVLGGVFLDLDDDKKAAKNYKTATLLKPKSELASLGLYVTLANLDKDKEAIEELFRFLKNHPADLYKVTLEELLEGLEKGYMTKYEKKIRQLARINRVE